MSGKTIAKMLLGAVLTLSVNLLTTESKAAELLMFSQRGCAWCQRWDRDIGTIYDKTEEAKLLPLRRIDIAQQTKSNVTLSSPIRYTPTFVAVDNGREIGRITGYINNDTFWGLLGALAAKIAPHAQADRI